MAITSELVNTGLHSSSATAIGGSWLKGVTAGTTQTQAGATALTAANNQIGTCANANDGVILPAAGAGSTVFVRNDGAQTAKIYPPVGGKINGGTANAAVTLAAAGSAVFRFETDLDSWS